MCGFGVIPARTTSVCPEAGPLGFVLQREQSAHEYAVTLLFDRRSFDCFAVIPLAVTTARQAVVRSVLDKKERKGTQSWRAATFVETPDRPHADRSPCGGRDSDCISAGDRIHVTKAAAKPIHPRGPHKHGASAKDRSCAPLPPKRPPEAQRGRSNGPSRLPGRRQSIAAAGV
jgi:hypothetical protein